MNTIISCFITSVITFIASYTFLVYKLKDINEVPMGTIVMWNGSLEDIPEGWIICDGENNTPDTMNRYVYGHIQPGVKFNCQLDAQTEKGGEHSHCMSKSGGGYADSLHKLIDNRDRTIVYAEVEGNDGHCHKIKKVNRLHPDSVTSIFIMKL